MVKLLESSIYDFGWARDEISFKSHILFGGKKVFNTKGIEIELAEEMLFFIGWICTSYTLLSDSKPLCNQKNVCIVCKYTLVLLCSDVEGCQFSGLDLLRSG